MVIQNNSQTKYESSGLLGFVTSIQPTIYKQQTTNNKQPTTNNKQQTTNNQQPTTNNQQPTTKSQTLSIGAIFGSIIFLLLAKRIAKVVELPLPKTFVTSPSPKD